MKLFATATLAIATLAGAASAMTSNGQVDDALRFYAPGVESFELTTAEANSVLTIVHGGDSEGEKRLKIRSIVQ